MAPAASAEVVDPYSMQNNNNNNKNMHSMDNILTNNNNHTIDDIDHVFTLTQH